MLNDPLNPTPPSPGPVVFPTPPGLHPKTGAQLATEHPAAAPPLTPLEALDQRVAALEAKVGGAVHTPDPFPKMLYHASSDPRVVNNKAEMDLLLSLGWTPEHVNLEPGPWDPTGATLHRSPSPGPTPGDDPLIGSGVQTAAK